MVGSRVWLLPFALSILKLEGEEATKSSARCSLFGDDHVKTFDGLLYDFAGDCSYLLAGDCHERSFSLLGDYQDRRRNGLSLYLGEYFEIRLFFDGTLTQGDKRVSIPYASNGIFIEMEAGYYKLSSEEFGFVVKADISGNVQIALTDQHYNKTCGLCGDFNGFAEDDFMTREGTLEENSYNFANSWAMHSTERRCRRVSPPSHTCNISSEDAEKGILANCQLLRTSTMFSQCHHLVDPEQYIDLCEEDMCTCGQERNCHCTVFLEYARNCAQQGVILEGWTSSTACRPRCPAGLEYKECTSPCAKTCQSLHINEACQEKCVDGCSCPEGKVLDGEHCVDSSDCSCAHAGKRHPPGSSIYRDCNSCICRHGSWICNNELCPGECSVTGQSHFKSFDNKHFTFSGVCHYLFAKDCGEKSFSVLIETVQCADDPDAVCTHSVSVQLQEENTIVKLKYGGSISLNGQDIQLPYLQGALRIQHTVMTSVRLTYRENMQIDWDGRGSLTMKLSSEFSEQTCGLCGNYNGNQGDDFLTPSGLVETLVEDFGNSWKLRGDCPDLQKQDSNSCNLNPGLAKYAEDSCSVLFSPLFEPCHPEVSPSPYVKNCRYDVCSCSSGKDCLCAAVSAYASACSQKGVLISWRQPDFCALSCPEGQIYQQCGSPCNQTCRSLSYPDAHCNDLCMEGCYCPVGLYLDQQGDCVSKSECSCYYDGEIFQPDDVFSDHHTMCYCENGFMHCSANRLPGVLVPDVFFQHRSSSRAKRSLTCRPPLTTFVCPANNPRAEGVECMKTCQNYDLDCASHGCVSGCLCPPGWVRHGNKCIALEKCPCFHNGQEFAPGETVTNDCNTCVCRARKWECTEHLCDGTCAVIGTAHYQTFDGLQYKFPGNCQYVLVQDYCDGSEEDAGTFRILVSNDGCGFTGQKCTKRISVQFGGGEIELYNGEVKIQRAPEEMDNLEVLKSGRYYILLLGRGISLTWDQNMGVTVILKGNYRDRVCGLCGNFDGVQNNDLTSSTKQLEVDPNDFGNSWKVNSQCADIRKGQGLVPSLCQGNEEKQMMVENSCSILNSGLFKDCAKLVDPEPYMDICMYDTCSCESAADCACFCDAIAAYAHTCAQKGVVVHWRSPTLCPQTCEHLNKAEEEGYQCEWRYNSCGPACPRTCQHFNPLACPVKCVEGCHVHCPAGKILDELSLTCIDVEECPGCEIEGLRVPHGQRIVLNAGDKKRCQSCHCEGRNLTCHECPVETPETQTATTVAPYDLVTREYSCSKMMDLAFLIDGTGKLSEGDFEQLKAFIIDMMEKLHISQKRIRLSILVYGSGSHIYLGLKDIKKPSQMRKIVQDIEYTARDVASVPEVLKYIVFHVFGKAPRTNAARIAVLFTASKDPRDLEAPTRIKKVFSFLKKRDIIVIPVGIGPHINAEQIKFIEQQSPENKAYIMSSVLELRDYGSEIIDYFCGLVPEIIPTTPSPVGPTMAAVNIPRVEVMSKKRTPSSMDIVFVVEGSDKVGEENFHLIKEFMARTISEMDIGEETVHITIIQYSFTITVEYSFRERQTKEDLIEKVRGIQFRGGNATNTGKAVSFVTEQTFTQSHGGREQVPHWVYMVTSNPATDTITNVFTDINFIPIGVTDNVNIPELELLAQPHAPIFLTGYDQLPGEGPELVLRKCCSRKETCPRPMDVIFLLDGSSNVSESQFEEMKNFVKAFIEHTVIGRTATQVAVVQYGKASILEFPWNMPQTKGTLLPIVSSIRLRGQGPSKLGEAIDFTVQHAASEANGGRPYASKIAVIVIAGASQDTVDAAVYSAKVNRVSLLPIGVGDGIEESELRTIAGSSATDRIIRLQHFDELPTLVSVGDEFVRKLCRETVTECRDEQGNRREPGDKWILLDRCHVVTCLPGGQTFLERYGPQCDKMPRPTCPNHDLAVKVEETCGCRWVCPCTCMGSSTRHIVTFDGQNFKLTGNCSYMLYEDKELDIEVVLQNGPCSSAPRLNCMNAMEVTHKGVSVQLSSNMMVTVNGKTVTVPYVNDHIEVNVHGAIMHKLTFSRLGHVLFFTPSNNEFSLQLSPKSFASETYGLCGVCDQNSENDFILKNGSVAPDSSAFIQEWTVKQPGQVCEAAGLGRCAEPATAKCSILKSPEFQACYHVSPPNMLYAECEQNGCYEEEVCRIVSSYAHACRNAGICVDWRSPDFCAKRCPAPFIYEPCRRSCTKHCENGSVASTCFDAPLEGCFCPEGQAMLDGSCVPEEVCSQCVGEDGTHHQLLETWIPPNEPCKVCVCLDNRTIHCTDRPCPTSKPPICDSCEVARLRTDHDQCCPIYECVCDLSTCQPPPVPHCEDGLQLVETNIGQCRPVYACVCKKEECRPPAAPSCPPHRKPTLKKTQCCDEYQCTCSCANSTAACPPGYLSTSLMNDCGCVSTTCLPDKVCVHRNVIYPVGKTWEEGCTKCSCTDMEDAVTGLRLTECLEKPCNRICPPGHTYINREGACCGRCLKTMCEEESYGSRGDEDVQWHEIGSKWLSRSDPCVIEECVRVNEEVFIQAKNVSCTQMAPPSCALGTELRCDQRTGCCPSCRCEPVRACIRNGTIIGPGKRVLLDPCTSCLCSAQRGAYLSYKLTCEKTTCEPCPKNYRVQNVPGACCGKCVQTACPIQLKNGTIQALQPYETVTDGCAIHSCKVNEKGDFVWEKRITVCTPFDANKCLAEGGRIAKIDNSCCDTCVEPECKQVTGRLRKIQVGDCVTEQQLDIHYCEGKCTSKAIYNISVKRLEDQCTCCSATVTDSMQVPLRCANGSVIHHEVFVARQCDCVSRKCMP